LLSHCPIRYKLLIGIAMLLVIVVMLAISGFRGVYAYRGLARSVSRRATELPLATVLAQHVSDLRVTLSKVRQSQDSWPLEEPPVDARMLRTQFRTNFQTVRETLDRYKGQLNTKALEEPRIGDNRHERETVAKIERSLKVIEELNQEEDWMLDKVKVRALDDQLENLHRLSGELPSFLHGRIRDFAGEVRTQYRVWIVFTWITSISALLMFILLLRLFWTWIFRPLRVLIRGSRQVAQGDFDHRIRLNTHDEMSVLAGAMNDMTERFQAIRDDLDRQVRERTRQVVRSEQMAGIGFLAAGVAHEINNPLASIAFCAESLTDRLHDIIQEDDKKDDTEHNSEISVLRNYLRMIQDQAFRCKDITEKLLDYSRMGDVQRQDTDLTELVQGVIDMVRHLGKYREKKIEFDCRQHVVAPVSPQEIKQVVLNLITNALDCIDAGGTVHVELSSADQWAELIVTDDGCGMAEEVLEHLFEPFYTRRRDGQGTGLGLSITYRIIADHGGQIDAKSEGPGQGAQFRVVLPLVQQVKEHENRYQAA